MRVKISELPWGTFAQMFCPGCESKHEVQINVGGCDEGWDWNGSVDLPTFTPSILTYQTVHRCSPHEHHVCTDPECGMIGHIILGHTEGSIIRGHTTSHNTFPAYGNCHSFVTDGRWVFLEDSAHRLAGQTVDMLEI